MVQSMISGHTGSMTTVHATSPRDAMVRLETLSLMSDVEQPVYVARAQAASAINIVVQLTRFVEDGSRKVTRITEQLGLDDQNRYQFRDLFVSRLKGRNPDGSLVADLAAIGNRPSFAAEPYEQGMDRAIRLTSALWERGR
jgi:pilus assembly protein CpaF